MAHWEVIRDRIKLFPHPNADGLQLGKVGAYQVVCKSGLYSDGDEVVFIPEKSVLPDTIAEPFRNYLKGPGKNRVGSVRLRGELSMGICLSTDEAVRLCGDIPDADIGEALGITKYEAPIPACLAGELDRIEGLWSQHDVEQFGIYSEEFDPNEVVVVTEKIHGSMVMMGLSSSGEFYISSKGVLSRGLCLRESIHNTYWRAAHNCGIRKLLEGIAASLNDHGVSFKTIQLFGEVIPVQGGNWTYGADPNKPIVRLFDLRVDGKSQSKDSVLQYASMAGIDIENLWVPEVASGFTHEVFPKLPELCRGNELVSGRSLHIREGVVVRPRFDRYASDGTRLMVKVINPAYAKKETGEEVS